MDRYSTLFTDTQDPRQVDIDRRVGTYWHIPATHRQSSAYMQISTQLVGRHPQAHTGQLAKRNRQKTIISDLKFGFMQNHTKATLVLENAIE